MLKISAASLLLVSVSSAAPVTPRSTERFIDSIGVCTHWSYTDTAYGKRYPEVKQLLLESGIRHVRDHSHKRAVDLGKSGINSTLLAIAETAPDDQLNLVKMLNSDGARIVAVEGPNEPDLFWERMKKSYKGQGHEQGQEGIIKGTIAYQKDLYDTFKADPATSYITIIGPSLGKTYSPDKGSPFPKDSLAKAVDWGNFHPYPGGNPFSYPSPYGGIERYIWHGNHPSVNLDEFPYSFQVYAPPFGDKPMSATETGYSTYDGATPELAHAKYLPRLFAEYFRVGIQRTYSYEFIDEFNKPEEREANFGLLRYDLTRKPAYHAIARTISLLSSDSSAPEFKPVPLDFEIKVEKTGKFTRTKYVRHILLQKPSGEHLLLLWHDIALEDVSEKANHRRLPIAPPMPTTLTFAEPIKGATLYQPNDSEGPIKTWEPGASSIKLGVLDRLMILELK